MPTNPTWMPTFPPRAYWACLCGLAALMAVLAPPASAQFLADPPSSLEQQALLAQQARRQAMERLRLGGPVTLEGAVDPDAYLVGPGDVFSVAVGGALSTETQAIVSADGVLVVPEVGGFPVAGLTLAEARTRVQAGLRRIYRNVSTEVALAQPRQFFVHVSGAVERPGRHMMVPIARVEDAVAAGMDDQSPLLVRRLRLRRDVLRRDADEPLPALRNVEVRRRDGSTERVDLLRYYATGDPTHNPYLRDGDAVYIPTLGRRSPEVVYVEREDRDPAAPPPPHPSPSTFDQTTR
jgi:polysaccharide biosynthesis/export protein